MGGMLSTIYLPHCNSLEITASLHLSTSTSTCTDPDATITTTLRALLPRLVYGVTYRLQTTLRPLLPLLVHDVDATCTTGTRTLASLALRPNCNYTILAQTTEDTTRIFLLYTELEYGFSVCFLGHVLSSKLQIYLRHVHLGHAENTIDFVSHQLH